MAEIAVSVNGLNPVHVPPKMWQDLTEDEKIERIREEFHRENSYKIRRIADLSRELDQLKEHSHLEGEIFIPLKRYHGDEACEKSPKRADGKFYF